MISNLKKYNYIFSNKFLFYYIIIFFFISVLYSSYFLKNLYNHNIVISSSIDVSEQVKSSLNYNNIIKDNLALYANIKNVKTLIHQETLQRIKSQVKINIDKFNAKKINLSNSNEIYFFEILSLEKNNDIIKSTILSKVELAFIETVNNNMYYISKDNEINKILNPKYNIIKSISSPAYNKLKSIIKLNILFISLVFLIYLINVKALKLK